MGESLSGEFNFERDINDVRSFADSSADFSSAKPNCTERLSSLSIFAESADDVTFFSIMSNFPSFFENTESAFSRSLLSIEGSDISI